MGIFFIPHLMTEGLDPVPGLYFFKVKLLYHIVTYNQNSAHFEPPPQTYQINILMKLGTHNHYKIFKN